MSSDHLEDGWRKSGALHIMIDNGVFEKVLQKNAAVVESVLALQNGRTVTVCAAQVGEYLFNGYDARSRAAIAQRIAVFPELDIPSKDYVTEIAMAIHDRYPRSIGAVDVYMVAYALLNDVAIITFDKHFLLARNCFPELEVHRLPQP